MANLCIIPARGGSKRIPRKNIKDFLGKPIIAYSIEAALKSNLFDVVMVSTDDNEIARIAIQYGATVPFIRSAENSNDFASTYSVLQEVISYYQKNGKEFEKTCCIYPCAPLILIDKLVEANHKLTNNNYTTVIPIVQYSNPIQRSFKRIDDRIEMFYPNYEYTRSQDLEPAFFDAGQFYWMQTKELILQKKIFTNNLGYVIIDQMHSQDIDNKFDWKLAELKFKINNNGCV